MYKRNNMLREKRKHANYKPNRRLDAKSSRGMIYENEELRIRTININAEVERGQSEIKNLKREREQLRREIWTLRDEYDKLENLLRIKGIDPDEFLNSNQDKNNENVEDDNVSECSECSCESCCDDDCCESERAEQQTTEEKNNENVSEEAASSSKASNDTSNEEHANPKRVGKDRLNLNFDHLSVVTEESEGNSITQSEDNSIPINDLSAFLHKVDVVSPLSYLQKLSPPLAHFENLPYDQIGGSVDQQGNIHLGQQPNISTSISNTVKEEPPLKTSQIVETSEASIKKQSRLKHFFSPIRKKNQPSLAQPDIFINNVLPSNMAIVPIGHSTLAPSNDNPEIPINPVASSSFQTGGNLEELLFDIENLSKDIMELQTHCADMSTDKVEPENYTNTKTKPFRSELSLVLSYPTDLQSELKEVATPSTLPASDLESPNVFYMQNLPSPFPSSTFPSSPLTPPLNFTGADTNSVSYVPDKLLDFTHLNFTPLNSSIPTLQNSSNSSIFCTVSAPSTPAFDRKCIDKFCSNEASNDGRSTDKKKSKRVSIVNVSDGGNEKPSQNTANESEETKESTEKKTEPNNAHHSHVHKSHSHSHLHPKRRMSLDNNSPQSNKHKNHRQISQESKGSRRESNRSTNSFKKRSRSDSAFGGHPDNEGGTSMSERYSNSIASSRESSTSLSLKSGKRRLSITSYGGSKKIPW